MYKQNDYVIYKRSVCKINKITKNNFSNKDYYSLVPLDDPTLTINIPVDKENTLLRKVMTKEEAENLISYIPNIEIIKTDDRTLETEYKKLMSSGKMEDLISIIKTTYLRNDARKNAGKKTTDRDNNYFNKAEKYLYNELAISLNMTYDEVKEYIIKKTSELCKY
jgi:CarD family transcriptional regulator